MSIQAKKTVLVLRAAQRDFVVPVSIRQSIKPAGIENGHSWLQLEPTHACSAAPYVARIFNPLTGEYFWAQQLTTSKWSQQVYT